MNTFFYNFDYETPERYDLAKFLEYTEFYNAYNSYFLDRLKTLSAIDSFRVTKDGRPDYLSYQIFGSTEYAWPLLFYNSIITVDSLKSGMLIDYFNIAELEELYFSLKSQEQVTL